MEPATDAELIRGSHEDPEIFERIFDRHYDAVRVYAQRRVGMEDGEEIAAETFVQAFAQRHRFRDSMFDSARPWLIGIANNLVRHHVRHQAVRRKHWLIFAVDPTAYEPSLDGLEALESRPVLRKALESLSKDDRETFLLVVLADLPYREVAQILQVPEGTVRSRINRARRRLRELLDPSEAINPGELDLGEPNG